MQDAGSLLCCSIHDSNIFSQVQCPRSQIPGALSQVPYPIAKFQFPGPRSCDSELNTIYPCNGVWVTFIDQPTNCSTSVFATWFVQTTIIVHEIMDYMNSMCECTWTWYIVYTQRSCLRQTSRSCWLQFETMLACPEVDFLYFLAVVWSKRTLARRWAGLHKSFEG